MCSTCVSVTRLCSWTLVQRVVSVCQAVTSTISTATQQLSDYHVTTSLTPVCIICAQLCQYEHVLKHTAHGLMMTQNVLKCFTTTNITATTTITYYYYYYYYYYYCNNFHKATSVVKLWLNHWRSQAFWLWVSCPNLSTVKSEVDLSRSVSQASHVCTATVSMHWCNIISRHKPTIYSSKFAAARAYLARQLLWYVRPLRAHTGSCWWAQLHGRPMTTTTHTHSTAVMAANADICNASRFCSTKYIICSEAIFLFLPAIPAVVTARTSTKLRYMFRTESDLKGTSKITGLSP